jgi:hypothetical protein
MGHSFWWLVLSADSKMIGPNHPWSPQAENPQANQKNSGGSAWRGFDSA